MGRQLAGVLTVALALPVAGCDMIFPFSVGDAGAGVDHGAVTELSVDGPGVGSDADAGGGPVDQGEEKTWPDASISKRAIWVKTFGGTGTEGLNDVAVASSGAIHVVGAFSGMFDIDGNTVDATGKSAEVLVVTLDNANGICQWAKAFGGPLEDSGRAVDVTPAGEVFVAGDYTGTLDMKINGQAPHAAVAGGGDIFLAKLSATGDATVSASLGGDGSDHLSDMILDGSNGVAMTGWFNGTSLITGTTTISRGNATVAGFIAYYTTAGSPSWSAPIAGQGHLYPTSLASNGQIELYIAGYYSGSADIDGDILAPTGGGTKESFIVSFENYGAIHWAYNAGNIPSWDQFHGIAHLPTQQIVMAGYFKGATASYGTNTVTGGGAEDAVLVLFDTPKTSESFTKAWRMGGAKEDKAVAVATDDQGNIYVTGYFQESADMGGATLTSNKLSQDLFVASYTSTGVHRWSERFGGFKEDSATSIAVKGGHVFVVGYFSGQAQFGPFSRAAVGSSDVFVLKLNAGT